MDILGTLTDNYTFIFIKFLGKDNLSGQAFPAEKASCTESSKDHIEKSHPLTYLDVERWPLPPSPK